MPQKLTPFEEICKLAEIPVIGSDVAKRAVLELLPCIKRTEKFAIRYPRHVASEITEYLDNVARDP